MNSNKDQRRDIIEETLGLERFNAYFEEAKRCRTEIENEITSILIRKKEMESRVAEFKQAFAEFFADTNIEQLLEGQMERRRKLLEEYETKKKFYSRT